jgi:guanylate kinase
MKPFLKQNIQNSTRFGRPRPDSSRADCEDKYNYCPNEEILNGIKNKEFVEFGEYGDYLYGTRLKHITDIISQGKICILDVNPWLRILQIF